MKPSKDEDIAYAITLSKILSWPLGTWPLQNYNTSSFIRFISTIGFLLLVIVVVISEIYLDRSNAETNLDVFLLIVCAILAVSKMICSRVYSARLIYNFVSALNDYNEINNEGKRTIMRRHAYFGRATSLGVILSSNICAVIFTILPIATKSADEMNLTVNNAVKYPVPSEHVITLLKLPEDLTFLIFCTEFLMLLIISVGNMGSDSLFFFMIFHLCGQAEVLKMGLNSLSDEDGRSTQNFNFLSKRHGYLLKLGNMLNETLSMVLVVQLFSSCILICTCGFQFILALNVGNIVMVVKTFTILTTLLIQLFAYSYVGDYLKCQLDGVGQSLYDSDWYELPRNVRKDIIFVIMKAQEPVHLTAGKFFVVNIETYMSIVKTSISYLSVLRVMINA